MAVHPMTVEELRVIRAWLLAISRTHFSEFSSYYACFNPAFLRLLFPSSNPIKFHADQFVYPFANNVEIRIKTLIELGPQICARSISYPGPIDPAESLLELACSTNTVLSNFESLFTYKLHELQRIVKVYFNFCLIFDNINNL
jgi:hypothetical protein